LRALTAHANRTPPARFFEVMIKSVLRRAFAALGLSVLLAAAPAEAKAPPSAKPALWAVSDADTTIYLFGTIHLLPDSYRWRTPTFDRAVEGSQELVVETIVDEKNPLQLASVMASLAFSPGLPPVAERVPPAKRAALAAAIKQSGYPPEAFDRMETWAVAFTLLGNQFKAIGLKGGQGVEAVLRGNFSNEGKPVGELESNLDQLSFFDTLPEKAQRELLEGAIEPSSGTKKDFGDMLGAWARGDVAAIARTFNHDLASSPEIRQALIERRNANWGHWIERRMAAPGTIMIAVGAGHLAGGNSVIALLKKHGYAIRRIQ
jgi:uncharacterized protein